MKITDQFFSLYSSNYVSAQTLIFIHGFPDNSNVWERQLFALGEKNHIILVSLPGTRGDGFEIKDYRLRDFVDCLFEQLSKLGSRYLQDVTIIGHDMGGVYACELVQRLNGIARLVLVDTMNVTLFKKAVVRPQQFWRSGYMLLFQLPVDRLLRLIVPKFGNFQKRPTNSLDTQLRGINSYRMLKRELLNYDKDDFQNIPLLVVWGKRDPFILPLKKDVWLNSFPKAEFVDFDCGHWPMFERADEFNNAIKDFCEKSFN